MVLLTPDEVDELRRERNDRADEVKLLREAWIYYFMSSVLLTREHAENAVEAWISTYSDSIGREH